jgi:hypothetical protein
LTVTQRETPGREGGGCGERNCKKKRRERMIDTDRQTKTMTETEAETENVSGVGRV